MDINDIKIFISKVLDDYHWPLICLLICLILVFVYYKHRYHYQKKDYLCSRSEQRLLKVLMKLLPNIYQIHCQVSLISLLKPSDLRSARMVWAKRMDFVITDKKSKILLVIELDDKSHERKDRKKRDRFVNKVLKGKHPLLRISTENSNDIGFVKNEIERFLADDFE